MVHIIRIIDNNIIREKSASCIDFSYSCTRFILAHTNIGKIHKLKFGLEQSLLFILHIHIDKPWAKSQEKAIGCQMCSVLVQNAIIPPLQARATSLFPGERGGRSGRLSWCTRPALTGETCSHFVSTFIINFNLASWKSNWKPRDTDSAAAITEWRERRRKRGIERGRGGTCKTLCSILT